MQQQKNQNSPSFQIVKDVSDQKDEISQQYAFKYDSQAHQMKDQIAIAKKQYPPPNPLARNRRFWMLKRLWKQGFFQQEQIMLKFPELYYEYVGKYKKSFVLNKYSSISQFLQSQVVNSQYRRLIEKNETNSQQKQEHSMENQQSSYKDNEEKQQKSPYEQKLQSTTQENLSLQQQALLDLIEEKFIEGLLPGFDYQTIDNDNTLDDRKVIDDDEEEIYFNSLANQDVDDPENNTNIQDF